MQDYYACPVCQEELEYDPCDEPCYERLMQEREAWISEHKI
jgi:transcription initiation factor IIE alpha subunit